MAVFATVLALAACGTTVEESRSITVGPEVPTEPDGETNMDGTDESDPTVTPPAVTTQSPETTQAVQSTESATAPDAAQTPTIPTQGSTGSTQSPTEQIPGTGASTQPLDPEGLPAFTPPGDTVSQEADGDAQLLVTDVRTAVHDGDDRVVLDLSGAGEVGWRAQFVTGASLDGSGAPVDLAGEFILRVDLQGMAYPEAGDTAYAEGMLVVDGGGLATVTEILRTGPFEGQVPVFIGARDEAPFRVFRLSDPARLVIDLQHD